ncbi:hypothetical protein H072_6437 [Dactylellina haptotyla CBS 200.50]|uniref:Vacuolar-sorting protein SNF7 n=1 Tax=Dactylellina haptotyla (strain CBS 200.50) TaxID=1284197 RepID=S8BWQ8_DACHA|nr:hypothetical protein H072_6437 [Dactylellina haptotyla CBS 200.50]
MSGFLSWFGGGGGSSNNTAAQTKTAIVKLREQRETLEKKEAHLENLAKHQEEIARKNVTTNKKSMLSTVSPNMIVVVADVALDALKKKKEFESQLDKTRGQITTLDTQIMSIESANLNYQTLEAMKVAHKAMKDMNKKHDIDKMDELLDSLEDQMATSNQIGDRISQMGMANRVDEEELLEEFAELEQQAMDQQMLGAGAPPVSALNSADKNKQPAKAEEEDEEEELRKLQAEMAM